MVYILPGSIDESRRSKMMSLQSNLHVSKGGIATKENTTVAVN
jgi:hypothetical protein